IGPTAPHEMVRRTKGPDPDGKRPIEEPPRLLETARGGQDRGAPGESPCDERMVGPERALPDRLRALEQPGGGRFARMHLQIRHGDQGCGHALVPGSESRFANPQSARDTVARGVEVSYVSVNHAQMVEPVGDGGI